MNTIKSLISASSLPDELRDRFELFWTGYTQSLAFTSHVDDETGDSLYRGQGDFDSNFPDCIAEYGDLLTDEERAELVTDAVGFFLSAQAMIEGEDEQAGVDFNFTRNHHGAGFWDGDWGDDGDKLTELSHGYGTLDLNGSKDEDDCLVSCYLSH